MGQAARRGGAGPASRRLFDATRPLKDILNGTWLGHPVHPVVTDVPVGAMTVAAVLDVTGQDTAADIAVAHRPREHGRRPPRPARPTPSTRTASRRSTRRCTRRSWSRRSRRLRAARCCCRLGPRGVRPVARLLSFAGYGAHGRGRVRRRRPRVPDGQPGRPARVRLALDEVEGARRHRGAGGHAGQGEGRRGHARCLYRATDGDPITALSCGVRARGRAARQGRGRGRLRPVPVARIAVPLADGHVARGPAVYDQPVYEVRETDGGGLGAGPSTRTDGRRRQAVALYHFR